VVLATVDEGKYYGVGACLLISVYTRCTACPPPLGYVPPAEFEQAYHDVRRLQPAWRFSRNERSGEPGAVHSTPSFEWVAWYHPGPASIPAS
jgi:hypothetical protein